jgi:hypothetical protein
VSAGVARGRARRAQALRTQKVRIPLKVFAVATISSAICLVLRVSNNVGR